LNKNNGLDVISEKSPQILKSGDLQINLVKQQAYFQNKLLQLPYLSYQLLKELMTSWPQTKNQDELIQAIWDKVQVQNSTLNQRVKLLRQSLQEQGCDPACIALVRGIGYRFLDEVVSIDAEKLPHNVIKTARKKGWEIITALIILFSLGNYFFQWESSFSTENDRKLSSKFNQQRTSITVVPFVSSSYASMTNNYLGNSFSSEILNSLADISALQVKGHDRFSRQKLTELNTNEIGKQLKVEHVIRGNITQVEDGFNIDIQLFATSTDKILWAKNYRVSNTELYFLKTDIAREIKTFLLPRDLQELRYKADPNLVNPKAYDLYLKAMDYHHRNTRKDNLSAQMLVKNAYELSPSCLDIISGYASVLNSGISLGSISNDFIDQAMNLANKAVELYPNVSAGYVELANAHMLQENDNKAFTLFNKALSLSPDNVNGLAGLSKIQIKNHKLKQALENIELLKILDPSSTRSLILSGEVFLSLDLYTQAKQNYRDVVQVEPDNLDALIGLAKISTKQNDFVMATKYYQLAKNFSPHSVKPFYLLIEILFTQHEYQQVIYEIENNRKLYEEGIDSQSLNEIYKLSQLLFEPVKNELAINHKIHDYQQIIKAKKQTKNDFLFLLRLLSATGQTNEVITWKNIEKTIISDRQIMVI